MCTDCDTFRIETADLCASAIDLAYVRMPASSLCPDGRWARRIMVDTDLSCLGCGFPTFRRPRPRGWSGRVGCAVCGRVSAW